MKKTLNHTRLFASLLVIFCLLVAPMTALAKKGEKNYKQGLKYESAQQWEKAAQEFTLAVAADPSSTEYQLHYRRAVFNASQDVADQAQVLRRVTNRDAVRVLVGEHDCLRASLIRRNRLCDDLSRIIRRNVRQIEGAYGELLKLRTPVLVRDENRAAIKLLEEQTFLNEEQVESLRRRHVRVIHFDCARLAERLTVEDHVEAELLGQVAYETLQIARELNGTNLLCAWRRKIRIRLWDGR